MMQRYCRVRRCSTLVAVIAVVTASASGTFAQPFLTSTLADPVALPPMPLADPEGAFAVDVHPAAVAWLPSWAINYVHSDARAEQNLTRRGDAFAAALPLVFGTALGVSGHSVRPTSSSEALQHGIGSLALGWAPSSLFSMGGAVRWVGSSRDQFESFTLFDVSLGFRPGSWLSVMVGGKNLNRPYVPETFDVVARAATASVAVRPLASYAVTGEFGAQLNDRGDYVLRTTLVLPVPYVGRLLATGSANTLDGFETYYQATVGLAVDWENIGVGVGTHLIEGNAGFPAWYATARLEGATKDGVPQSGYMAELDVQGDDPRRVLEELYTMEQMLHNPRVRSVLLRPADGVSIAHAQEYRQLIDELQKRNKPVVCVLQSASTASYYLCANAAHLWLDTAGGITMLGVRSQTVMFGDVLQTVGVRADFVRIGQYKSAPEQFTRRTLTEPARRQRNAWLDDVYHRMLADLGRDANIPRARVQSRVDHGPYTAIEAKRDGLVHQLVDVTDLDAATRSTFGRDITRRTEPPNRYPDWGIGSRVGVVRIDGNIVDGKSVDIPGLDIHLSGGDTVSEAVTALATDPTVRAIVLRIDSGGGSALASDQIWRAVMRAREKKPVVASLGGIAASGGYYIASAAHEIWCPPSGLTGSIGIFFGKVDVAPLAEKIGLGVELFTRGKYAGADSMWRPFTEDERTLLMDKIEQGYHLFLQRVSAGRGKPIAAIDAVGQGRVWSCDSAKGVGLVDHLGGFASALARARQLGHTPAHTEVVFLPKAKFGLLGLLLGAAAEPEASAAQWLPRELQSIVAPWLLLSRSNGYSPLALTEEFLSPPR
jgi:protease-4